jgi:DNA helicase IV
MNINSYKEKTIKLLADNKRKEFICQMDYLNTFTDDANEVEDVMYYLYCKDHIKSKFIEHQHVFLYINDNNEYKKLAINYLRKEKLNKVNENSK